MNTLKAIPLSLATAALLSPAVTFADDDTGFYLGVAVNRLSADFEDERDIDFEDSDNAASIKFGYMFNDIVGLEIGYLDLGGYVAEGDTPDNRIDIDADARSVAVVGNWSVMDQLDLYGKLGLYNTDVDSRSTIAGNVIDNDDDENEVFGAFGAEYDLGNFNLFAEFSVADTDINDLAIDIATAGVKFEF